MALMSTPKRRPPTKTIGWRAVALLLSSVFVLAACGVSFDSAAELKGLRVMTVKKSLPYAQPGDVVDMRMLYHDEVDEPRDVQILWLRGCQNPPGDLVQLCFEVFSEILRQTEGVPPPPQGEASEEDLAQLATSLAEAFDPERILEASGLDPEQAAMAGAGAGFGTFEIGFGETFQLTVSEDIISSRLPPADPKLPPYGIEYVFAATCAGQLWIDPDAKFPIGCFDERGRPVGADRYVVSYTKLWAYDELENPNPRILGIEVDGDRLSEDEFCLDEACETLAPEADDGVECPRSRRLRTCEDEDELGSCPKLPLRVIVDEDSVDEDGVLSSLQEAPVTEQMWVNYFTDAGSFTYDLALVNDSTAGFNDEPNTEFTSPEEPGIAHVWAVVHDNRGGASWARFEVCLQD